MKKLITIVSGVLLLVSMTGCVSTKKIRYFQGADSLYVQAQRILQEYEMRLKPADQVYIKVTCSEPDLLEVFENGVVIGGTSSGGGNMGGTNTSLGNINAFTVDTKGDVILPRLGTLHLGGLTTDEAARLVEARIRETGLLTDPEVTVRLLNARVIVLGAVSSPGIVSLSSERYTIFDVMAQCGDVDDTGLRYKIQLYREVDGLRYKYDIDLTKVDVFQSPAYYVQQNDLIYVEPNKSKSVKASPFYTFMSAGLSIIGAIVSIISFGVLVSNKVKGN